MDCKIRMNNYSQKSMAFQGIGIVKKYDRIPPKAQEMLTTMHRFHIDFENNVAIYETSDSTLENKFLSFLKKKNFFQLGSNTTFEKAKMKKDGLVKRTTSHQ